MHYIFILLFMLAGNTVSAVQQTDPQASEEGPWPTYGYIALGALILIAVIFTLLRKQHRKFNE